MTGRVEGKVAFITGAARGQGRSHAVRLAEEGADIVAVDIATDVESTRRFYPGARADDLAETAAQVEALDRRIVTVQADVRDLAALQQAVAEGVAELGHIDIVCANAGIFHYAELAHEVAESDWADLIDINLTGVWRTCKAVIPQLIEQGTGGSIVLVNSTAGLRAGQFISAYAASKHGLVGLMRTLVNELGPHSVRVNSVHPTGVATDMLLNPAMYQRFRPDLDEPSQDDARPAFRSLNLLPVPWVEPVDVSNAVLFLASDESRYVSGCQLTIDAGSTSR